MEQAPLILLQVIVIVIIIIIILIIILMMLIMIFLIMIMIRLSNARSNMPTPAPSSPSKILHNLIIVILPSGGVHHYHDHDHDLYIIGAVCPSQKSLFPSKSGRKHVLPFLDTFCCFSPFQILLVLEIRGKSAQKQEKRQKVSGNGRIFFSFGFWFQK